jgi:hypothetical protein
LTVTSGTPFVGNWTTTGPFLVDTDAVASETSVDPISAFPFIVRLTVTSGDWTTIGSFSVATDATSGTSVDSNSVDVSWSSDICEGWRGKRLLMLLVKYRNTYIGHVGICIVPAEFHKLRLHRFTVSEVSSVVDQLLMFKRTAY